MLAQCSMLLIAINSVNSSNSKIWYFIILLVSSTPNVFSVSLERVHELHEPRIGWQCHPRRKWIQSGLVAWLHRAPVHHLQFSQCYWLHWKADRDQTQHIYSGTPTHTNDRSWGNFFAFLSFSLVASTVWNRLQLSFRKSFSSRILHCFCTFFC